jgi:PhnB protein
MSTSTQSTVRKETRMATRITPYIRFDGNCSEAMKFYKNCFGGDLSVMTVAESPMAGKVPSADPKDVFHASLSSGSNELLASDMVPDGLTKGNAMVLALQCASEQELRTHFSKLSAGGKVVYPVDKAVWGGLYGQLVDKFGNEWMLNFTSASGSNASRM